MHAIKFIIHKNIHTMYNRNKYFPDFYNYYECIIKYAYIDIINIHPRRSSMVLNIESTVLVPV